MDDLIFRDVALETERLYLRCFRPDDKEEFYTILQDPPLYATLPEDHMYDRGEVSEIIDWFIERYSQNAIGTIAKFPLAIVSKENDKIIGDIGIGACSLDESRMELFYFISSSCWNKGYASEATAEFLSYVRKHELVKNLLATVVNGNVASERILIKNGFRKIDHAFKDERDVYELILSE